MLPRSQGGLLMSTSPSNDTLYSTSPISEYSSTVPDTNGQCRPSELPNRQSTGTSEALQYYWSSSAGGERSGSISSNLGMSPIESPNPSIHIGSPYSLSPHPATMSPHALVHHSSSVSLNEIVAQDAEQERLGAAGAFSDAPDEEGTYEELQDQHMMPRPRVDGPSEAGPSNRRIHLVSYSSDGSVSRLGSLPSHSSINNEAPPSPTDSNSGESEYSLPDESIDIHRTTQPPRNELYPRELHPKPRQPSARSSERPRGLVDTDGKLDILLDPSFEEWAHQRVWADSAGDASPATTITGGRGVDSPLVSPHAHAPDQWHTPTTSIFERRQRMSPPWSASTASPARPQDDRTPRNSTQTLRGSGSKLPGAKGRMLFVAPPGVSRWSLDELEREVNGRTLGNSSPQRGSRLGLSIAGKEGDGVEIPHSAPPHKTSFGDIEASVDDKSRRPTSLLPSVQMASPRPPQTSQLSPPREEPVAIERRSPEPPPRSERRKLHTPVTPETFVESPLAATPREESPPRTDTSTTTTTHQPQALRNQTLPTIINTPHTPVASPQAPGRSPERAATAPLSFSTDTASRPDSPRSAIKSSGTLQDLSDLLSGAIDDIGLIDSRDTPPPTVGEPPKTGHTARVLSQLPTRTASAGATAHSATPSVPITHDQPQQSLSPTSANFSGQSSPSGRSIMNSTAPVGLGIIGSVGAVGASVAAVGSAATQRTSNNVARHVRKASSILSMRSTNYSVTSPTVPTPAVSSKLPSAILYSHIKNLKSAGERARAYEKNIAGLGQTDSGLSEWIYNMQHAPRQASRPEKQQAMAQLGLRAPEDPTARNVSTGSEFPMRADAYAAREISVRNMDPSDAPTALPTNLPYPQLQGVKGSGSMQSLVSISSTSKPRAGIRNIMGKLRRDKENTGLGPPTGSLAALNPNASSSKRDLRDLRNVAISGPRLDNPSRHSFDSIERVNPSLAVPRGPRDAPSARASFDAPRGSTDSTRSPGNAALHPSPLRGGGYDVEEYPVSDDDVRNLSELLPQSERAVVRHYLARYGDPSCAMSAYIEDQKRGQLLQV